MILITVPMLNISELRYKNMIWIAIGLVVIFDIWAWTWFVAAKRGDAWRGEP